MDRLNRPTSLSRWRERAGVRVDRARQLRHGHTDAEALLWRHLRSRQRELFMREAGFITLRFWNHEVLAQTEAVLEKIFQTLQTLTPTLSRQREREERNSSEERDS